MLIVNAFKLFPKITPEIVDAANLETAIAASDLISASTITPAAIAVALPIEVTSPVRFALVVTLDAVPVSAPTKVVAVIMPVEYTLPTHKLPKVPTEVSEEVTTPLP